MYRPLLLCALALHLYPSHAQGALIWVHSPNISLSLDAASGQLRTLNASSLVLDISGSGTTLGDTAALPTVLNVSVSPLDGGVRVSRWLRIVAQRSNASCCTSYDVLSVSTLESVPPAAKGLPSAISWRLDVTSAAPAPWRTAVTHVFASAAGASHIWTPRGGNTSKAASWEDTLRMTDAARAPAGHRTQYGQGFLFDDAAGREVSPVPAAVLAFATANSGVGIMQALDDSLFGVTTDVTPHSATLTRYYNREGEGRTVSLGVFLVPLLGVDWRPLFLWARGALPRFFLSSTLLAAATAPPPPSQVATKPLPHPHAHSLATTPPRPVPAVVRTGLGLYSCANIEDMNVTAIQEAGATHNWDARFEWPYIGMYLPPIVPPDASWTSNLGSGEEPDCGTGWRHGQLVNTSFIARAYANAGAQGITTLTYFNLVEYGENFVCPLPPPITPNPQNDWRNSSQFAADHFPLAPWPGCPGTGWQGGVDLNPADPAFAAFLVAQAQLHVTALGSDFRGFAIDRFDHTSQWYMNAPASVDDGLAWCGVPCTLLLTGFSAALARVAAVVYSAPGALMTGNFVGAQRVDVLQHIDGIMEEDYEAHAQLVMTSGLATTGMAPCMIWTYSASEVANFLPNADAYFAQHVLLRAAPFAPVRGNDHSIQPAQDPTGAVQALYAAWAPMFVAYAGGCWWLTSQPVRAEAAQGNIDAAALLLNAFTTGGGCTDVSTASGTGPVAAVIAVAVSPAFSSAPGDAVVLSLADAFDGEPPAACDSIVPGGSWAPVALPHWDGVRWRFDAPLPLARGAVMLRCTRV